MLLSTALVELPAMPGICGKSGRAAGSEKGGHLKLTKTVTTSVNVVYRSQMGVNAEMVRCSEVGSAQHAARADRAIIPPSHDGRPFPPLSRQ
jgi:hypothetical protein